MTDTADQSTAPGIAAEQIGAAVLETAAELLGEPVSASDNFFAQGGTSLMAARFVAQLSARLPGVPLSLDDVFHHPVVGDLAQWLSARLAEARVETPTEAADTSTTAATTDSSGTTDVASAERAAALGLPGHPVPLTYSQERRRERDVASIGERIPHHITSVFHCQGPVDSAALALACRDVVARHPSLRTLFASDSSGHAASCASLDQLRTDRLFRETKPLDSTTADRVVEEDADDHFDLAQDVKLRVSLVRLNDGSARLVVTTEHLVCDGESFTLLLQDLSRAYAERVSARTPDLGTPPMDGAGGWGEPEQLLNQRRLDSNLDYWRRTVDPLEAVPELRFPSMYEPATQPTTAARAHAEISPELVDRLRQWCADHGCGLYSGFLSALGLSVLAHTGHSVVGVVGPTSVRPEGWEHEVAWFATSSIFRFRINSELPTSEVLRSARTSVLDSVAHAMPLPLLLNYLQPERDTIQRWRPWLYLGVEEDSGQMPLSLAGVQVTDADAELYPALRPGVSIGVEVGTNSTSVMLQYEAEAWSADNAAAFTQSLASSVELLPGDRPVLECARLLRERRHLR